MKKRFAILTIALMTLISFNALAQGERKSTIDIENSHVHWKGKKVTGSHEGDIALSEGALEFEGTTLTGGNFSIDMTTMTCEDIENANANAKFIRHLHSDDFFGTETYKTATMSIKSATKTGEEEGSGKASGIATYDIVGAFTIKGITQEITFPATLSFYGTGGVRAEAEIVIDRTLFDIHYGSDKSLGDRMIYKNFELEISIASQK